jgi:hypothetical protein
MIESDDSSSDSARVSDFLCLEIGVDAGMIVAAGEFFRANMPLSTRINGDFSPSCFIDDANCAFTVAAGVAPSVS